VPRSDVEGQTDTAVRGRTAPNNVEMRLCSRGSMDHYNMKANKFSEEKGAWFNVILDIQIGKDGTMKVIGEQEDEDEESE